MLNPASHTTTAAMQGSIASSSAPCAHPFLGRLGARRREALASRSVKARGVLLARACAVRRIAAGPGREVIGRKSGGAREQKRRGPRGESDLGAGPGAGSQSVRRSATNDDRAEERSTTVPNLHVALSLSRGCSLQQHPANKRTPCQSTRRSPCLLRRGRASIRVKSSRRLPRRPRALRMPGGRPRCQAG